MAFSEELAARVRTLVSDWPNVSEKKMFGGLAFMLNDYMFIGVRDDALMVRVGKQNHTHALQQPHARPMDFTGRPLRGYVYVDAAGTQGRDDLQSWIATAADFVRTLPPKEKKSRR